MFTPFWEVFGKPWSLVSLSVSLNGQIGSVFLMDFGGDTWQIVARFFQKMGSVRFFLGT